MNHGDALEVATMKENNYTYKDSGIEWLGEVPEHWDIVRIDSISKYEKTQINPEDIETDIVFHYSIPAVQETGGGIYEQTDTLNSAKQVVTKKIILISKLNPRKATICIAEPQDIITVCSTEFIALEPVNCDMRFLYYLLNSEMNRQRLDARVQSVTRSHQRVNPSDIHKFWVNLPSKSEQQSSAAFLDHETARIDALIQKQERMIELLKEKRTALITQAVTKGLDPTVKMKDSGIEWLGEVPEHWEVMKIKHVALFLVSNVDKKTKDGEAVVRLINYTDVYNNEFLTNKMNLMQSTAPEYQIDKFGVLKDDIIITKDSEDWTDIAKPALVKSTASDIVCGYHLAIIRSQKSKAYGCYVFRALQSTVINHQFQIKSNGITRFGLPKSGIGDSIILIPSLVEQQTIASFLDRETANIDSLIQKQERAIELLREYRASLIHHAVTGKIDLRDYDVQTQ